MGTLVTVGVKVGIAHFLYAEPALSQIDFYVGTTSRIHVTGAELRNIGDRIISDLIQVEVDDAYLAERDFGAEYRSKRDTITMLSSHAGGDHFADTLDAKVALTHEAVHAALDARGKKLLAIRDECAAYIAGAIYLRSAGKFADIFADDSTWKKTHVRAAEIVSKFALYTNRGVHLSGKDVRPLAKVVKDRYGHSWATRGDHDGLNW